MNSQLYKLKSTCSYLLKKPNGTCSCSSYQEFLGIFLSTYLQSQTEEDIRVVGWTWVRLCVMTCVNFPLSVQCLQYNDIIMSWTNVFNEPIFWEILLPSSGRSHSWNGSMWTRWIRMWIIKYQNFKHRYQTSIQIAISTNTIESSFKKFFNDCLINIWNFSSRNFANNIDKPGLHFENSNLDEHDIDRNRHADKNDINKDKCICSIDILLATEMSGNAHEDLTISFKIAMMTMMMLAHFQSQSQKRNKKNTLEKNSTNQSF